MTQPTTETVAPEAAVPASLTVNDLTLALQVIQVATSRGTFKPEELSSVGSLYDRIVKFLESTGALTRTPAAETSAPAEPQPAPVKKPAPKAKGKK